jgi:transposase
MEWSASVLTSETDTPSVCQMSWWTTKGNHRTCRDDVFYTMLRRVSSMIKWCNAAVCHVFDRGYASASTLEKMFNFNLTFILRFKSNILLKDQEGIIKNTYRFSVGKRAFSSRRFLDKERGGHRKVSILYVPVTHPEWDDKQLYLVIVRDKTNKTEPMYLLTNELVDTVGMAWAIFKRYMKRWDIEQTFRAAKSSLAIQSLRLWFWENRLKLLFIVTLVLDFLLHIISKHKDWGNNIIQTWRPRTGKKHKRQKYRFPFYELRAAIALLLLYLMNGILFLKRTKATP